VPMNLVPMNLVPMNLVPMNLVPMNLVPMNLVPMNLVPMNLVHRFLPKCLDILFDLFDDVFFENKKHSTNQFFVLYMI
jgi:hypothetical protein